CRHPQFVLVADRRAVPLLQDGPVDLDPARRGYQVAATSTAEFIGSRLARPEPRAEYPCVGMDTQGTGILVHPARQGDETPRALRVREGARAPRGRQAASFGDDPDLEYLRDAGFQIVFAMDDTRAGAHDLDVAGLGPALVALAVPVADRAPAHVGDDLHVGMRMRREAGAGLDRVVVPDAQRAPAHPVGIVVVGEGEVMPRVEPAVVGAAEALEGSAFDHGEGSHCVNDARMGAKVT